MDFRLLSHEKAHQMGIFAAVRRYRSGCIGWRRADSGWLHATVPSWAQRRRVDYYAVGLLLDSVQRLRFHVLGSGVHLA